MTQRSQAMGSSGIREWANNNSALITIIAVLALIGAVYAVYSSTQGPTIGVSEAYYYDPVTRESFGGDLRAIPPIDHNGNQAVRVWWFGCDGCGEKFVGYYEKYTDEAKEAIEAVNRPSERELSDEEIDRMNAFAEAASFSGRLVSADAENWVPAQSPEGQEIEGSASEKCAGKRVVNCAP